jgi:hypothetical protein
MKALPEPLFFAFLALHCGPAEWLLLRRVSSHLRTQVNRFLDQPVAALSHLVVPVADSRQDEIEDPDVRNLGRFPTRLPQPLAHPLRWEDLETAAVLNAEPPPRGAAEKERLRRARGWTFGEVARACANAHQKTARGPPWRGERLLRRDFGALSQLQSLPGFPGNGAADWLRDRALIVEGVTWGRWTSGRYHEPKLTREDDCCHEGIFDFRKRALGPHLERLKASLISDKDDRSSGDDWPPGRFVRVIDNELWLRGPSRAVPPLTEFQVWLNVFNTNGYEASGDEVTGFLGDGASLPDETNFSTTS